jgi:uncharacterized protein YxeA
MKNIIKIIITLAVIISMYILATGILNYYSVKYSKEAIKYERLYNKKVTTYTSKKSDLSYYKSGLYIKRVATDRFGFIEPNDDSSLVTYSKVITNEKNVTFTVILDLFSSTLSADELKPIYSY